MEHKPEEAADRIIGQIDGRHEGPLVILLAGMHGNEPAGVRAVKEVLMMLEDTAATFRGKVVAVRANRTALQRKVRYIDEDMNRLWFPSIIEQIRSEPEHALSSSERVEIKQLLQVLDRLEAAESRTTILADIHTFSARGSMFTLPNRAPEQLELLSKMYAPMVLGIGETLRGTALKYYHNKGIVSFALEGGQHENRLTPHNITASLMLLLESAGCIDQAHYPEIPNFRDHLQSQTRHLPVQTELVYQHIIEEGDNFVMRPGYHNFQPITKGEWLATDREGKIRAQCDGYVLMPLYQNQGNDGFFIIKEHEA